jgi:glucose-6-phosphate 1-dehydrogenase
VEDVHPDLPVVRIQPHERIQTGFGAKVPGPSMRIAQVDMVFPYMDYLGNAPATGHTTPIDDCMHGDATLFKHADRVEKGWDIVQSAMDLWHALPARDLPKDAAGTWGPKAAGDIPRNEGRRIETPAPGQGDGESGGQPG